MTDALSTFKPTSGLYLKFTDGDEIKLRILTLDPLVSEKSFENKSTGEVTLSTKYAFIVWNWSEEKAQVLEVGPGLLNRFVRIHQDEDLPALNKTDIKISATGEMLGRRYDVVVLPTSKELSKEAVKEAHNLKLEELVKDSKGRLSEFADELPSTELNSDTPGYDKAKATASNIGKNEKLDTVEDVNPDEEVNLNDIPF